MNRAHNLTPTRNSQGKGHSRTQSNQRLIPSSQQVEESAYDDEIEGTTSVPLPATSSSAKTNCGGANAAQLVHVKMSPKQRRRSSIASNDGDGDDSSCCLTQFLDRHLVGNTDSKDFSEAWGRKFSQHPSWSDADMCLQQIKLGNANGNRAALYARSFFQRTLYGIGRFVQRWPYTVLCVGLVILVFCSFGLRNVRIETDLEKLWVAADGRLSEELQYFSTLQKNIRGGPNGSVFSRSLSVNQKHYVKGEADPKLGQIPEDESSSSGFQVLIQTVEEGEDNLLTKKGLLRHVHLMEELMHLSVEKFARNWTLADICFKPGGLDISNDSIAYSMKSALERLIPCIWITPIDCFWEGSLPIGPDPPLKISLSSDIPMSGALKLAIPDLPEKAAWASMNPRDLVEKLDGSFSLGTMKDFFLRTGIEEGYLDRLCIDPLDHRCPATAPNYYQGCDAIHYLNKHLTSRNKTLAGEFAPYIKDSEKSEEETSVLDIFAAYWSSDQKKPNVETTEDSICTKYREPFLKWLTSKLDSPQWKGFFPKKLLADYPDYGDAMRHGCNGFARGVLNWPVDMILGGVRYRSGRTPSFQAEALQSVILVSSPTEVYKRLKESAPSPEWSPLQAKEIIAVWQRTFASYIYNHELNFKTDRDGYRTERRIIHPLASTSISDMLADFCDFNYLVIFLGYMLMLLYAVYSQLRWDGFCLLSANSATGLAFAGVLTVTLASVAGLGTSTWFQINFNAATTQIVPFLTLGIGVDNMFLLLHNYPQVTANVKANEIGVLMKETGMSILMTSTNNILSFLAGTVLPIPALRSFCAQTSILLSFNLLAILTIYPALISLDLRRKKKGRRDLCCCCTSDDAIEASDRPYGFDLSTPALTPAQELLKGTGLQEPTTHYHILSTGRDDDEEIDEVQPYTLRAFLNNYYIPLISSPWMKTLVVVLCLGLFVGGIVGIRSSSMGLELSDVLPKHTAPAAFLQAREKYFSFYPMYLVVKDVDLAKHQHSIRQLRDEVGHSKWVGKLKSGEPSERYWLGIFVEWLEGMQKKLDEAESKGWLVDFDHNNVSKTPELNIAYSLACSYGDQYDCSRVGRIRLIDESGTVNPEGFYNYLNGWVEYESMFYAASQASFYPPFHKLRQGPPGRLYRYFIPPARQPAHSRIPFYMTGLKDTTSIVAMIREIRAISENFSRAGVINYPQGIAFTFWEQYLDLNVNLVKAIAIISLCIFCVISILLFNPWAACCILMILVMMTVELAGFLAYCGIKFNPITVVSLISAMGIGVEFTAHVVFAFLTALGTRNERMAAAIDQVFVPVIHGALSTLLGILMLGFSQFEFVFKYFFVVMTALIIIGLINGLALLPVLLSIMGPSTEVRTKGMLKRLAPPPPRSADSCGHQQPAEAKKALAKRTESMSGNNKGDRKCKIRV